MKIGRSGLAAVTALCAASVPAQAVAGERPNDVPAGDEAGKQTVVVTSTRDRARTQFDTLAPVDVLSQQEIQSSVSSDLSDAYVAAFERYPRIRLTLLTHFSHRTGLVLPVRDIAAAARARGIDVTVDAAHSWYQLDFALPDLDCDFIGLNGHKWLGAPLGMGAIHVRRAALDRIDRHPVNDAAMSDDLQARVYTGTLNFAAQLTVPAALAFQQRIGRSRRAARLAALRNRWVAQVRDYPKIDILTPDDPTLHGSITSFRSNGITTEAGNAQLAKTLPNRHGIFTVHRAGIGKGACVRVSSALFNSPSDIDALANALKDAARWQA